MNNPLKSPKSIQLNSPNNYNNKMKNRRYGISGVAELYEDSSKKQDLF